MNRVLVETEGLCRFFAVGGEVIKAVDEVNLAVPPGEFIAIMGPSGSGKTTLLNLIGLLDHPSRGRVVFEGKDTSGLKGGERDRLRLLRIGFIFQRFNLLPTFTALENVTFPMLVAGVGVGERRERGKALLGWVGLAARASHRPYQLSAGESQRVAIARALANQPRLILADEPTGNLDSKSKDEVVLLLKRVNEEYGTSILLVTHDPMVAAKASRVLTMRDGKLY